MAKTPLIEIIPGIGKLFENSRVRKELQKARDKEKYLTDFRSGSGSGWGGLGFGGNAPSTFLDVITAGKDGLNFDTNPRDLLRTYRAIIWALPYFKTAMTIHQDMTGCPIVESEDKGLAKELNARWDAFNVTTYKNKLYKIQKGADAFKNRLMGSADSQGIGFAELYRDESGKPLGSVHYNPEMFSVNCYPEEYRFAYSTPTEGTKEIMDSLDFIIHISRVSDKWEWGLPICYNAEYFATLIVSMMESRMSFEAMFGNPLVQLFLTNKADTSEGFDDTQWTATERAVDRINKDIQTALKSQLKYRKSSIMTHGIPGNLSLEATTMGQGLTASASTPELLKAWTEIVVLTTDCPGSFLGMAGSAGIGSDRFRIEKGFMMNRAKQNQYSLEPHLNNVTYAMLQADKASPKYFRPDAWKWHWERPNIDDEKQASDIKLVDATTMEKQLANLVTMKAEGNADWEDAAGFYIDEIEKPYLKDLIKGTEFEPEPAPTGTFQ